MSWLIKELSEAALYSASKLPWGYGVVRKDWHRRYVILAPIPLNLLMRWAEDLVWWVTCAGFRGGHQRDMERMWELGREEGRKQASELEYDRGREVERARAQRRQAASYQEGREAVLRQVAHDRRANRGDA